MVAITVLLAFGGSSWQQSRAADATEDDATQPDDCLDVTPHEVTFVTVEPGVQLEVLDFGGTGDAMVLLTGLGDNAHVWDGFAYQFTDNFHVIGITRRGFGRSDQPEDGYDIRTRARDDIRVIDHFGIRQSGVCRPLARGIGNEPARLRLSGARRQAGLSGCGRPRRALCLRGRAGGAAVYR